MPDLKIDLTPEQLAATYLKKIEIKCGEIYQVSRSLDDLLRQLGKLDVGLKLEALEKRRDAINAATIGLNETAVTMRLWGIEK